MSFLSQFRMRPLNNQGVYSATTSYTVNDVVTFQNLTYCCRVPVSLGVAPTNTTNWGVISSAPTLTGITTGSGTNAAAITLTVSGNVITLNHP